MKDYGHVVTHLYDELVLFFFEIEKSFTLLLIRKKSFLRLTTNKAIGKN
jgi:hypothetical protein